MNASEKRQLSKMAAKSKKRLIKIENKLLKLDKLELKDVICSICQSILIEPVTLPCYHDFCLRCFNGSVENNALCCPLCRLRIGSWLRTATRHDKIVNIELWKFIKFKFSQEVDIKSKGEDIIIPEETPILRLSAPGEIRSEYESEINRLKRERMQLEQKQFQETELLIKKIQQEEQEAQNKYLERLKQDELLALHLELEHQKTSASRNTMNNNLKHAASKPRLKAQKIDSYLSKIQTPSNNDSILTNDNSEDSMVIEKTDKPNNKASPEIVPSNRKLLRSIIDKRYKNAFSFWNKENGDNEKEKKGDPLPSHKETAKTEDISKERPNGVIKSLLVSLPLPCAAVLQRKAELTENRNLETGSADSMRQELCYFKPIEKVSPSSFKLFKCLPLRVPCQRVRKEPSNPCAEASPTRAQYIEGLCRLRNLSLANNLPSAFVIALSALKTKKESPKKCEVNCIKKLKRAAPDKASSPAKRHAPNKNKTSAEIVGTTKLSKKSTLKRTRSMGSISKELNETTPKKAKIQRQKANSERKPHLRSDSKKLSVRKRLCSPSTVSKTISIDKVNLAVKNLSSPLENCDVEKILQEQLRIERAIEQEKIDLKLALKMDAELNGKRETRQAAAKRQLTLTHTRGFVKKLKV